MSEEKKKFDSKAFFKKAAKLIVAAALFLEGDAQKSVSCEEKATLSSAEAVCTMKLPILPVKLAFSAQLELSK